MLKVSCFMKTILMVFALFYTLFSQGSISPLVLPGQNSLQVGKYSINIDYYQFLNYGLSAPMDNHVNVTFANSFAPNIGTCRCYVSLT
jgi:hypothetical protein